jgi:hypothetical protein
MSAKRTMCGGKASPLGRSHETIFARTCGARVSRKPIISVCRIRRRLILIFGAAADSKSEALVTRAFARRHAWCVTRNTGG